MAGTFISIYGTFNIVHDLYSCVVFHMEIKLPYDKHIFYNFMIQRDP